MQKVDGRENFLEIVGRFLCVIINIDNTYICSVYTVMRRKKYTLFEFFGFTRDEQIKTGELGFNPNFGKSLVHRIPLGEALT